MSYEIAFAPLVPLWIVYGVAALAIAITALAFFRRLSGWALRGLAVAVIALALAGPALQEEASAPLSDIVLLVEDRSASQRLSDRAVQTAEAAEALAQRLAERPNTEVRRITVGDGADNAGTQLMTALTEAIAEEPKARIAGAILLSDGRLHDLPAAPDLPAPLQLLLSGEETDWDRRLIVSNAPAFAILDEEITLTLRVEDQGAVPTGLGPAELSVSVDGAPARTVRVPVEQDMELPLTLPHGGRNVIEFKVTAVEGELTDRNNSALVQMNGVRDRLSVLLVSGVPHAGERTWRNLLKSDSSVDLVHFTILRPPEKQDGVPVTELSLIAFPTRELFLDKIDDFDLIIFDRYKRRGILPALYLDNVRNYIENGGAVLVSAGPDYANVDSLYRSPLGEVLPGEPTARVVEEAYLPRVTEQGQRHPVTEGLAPIEGDPNWGRWLRQIEVDPKESDVVMTGIDDLPLLLLNRVGEGRVALLASDQAWLWGRGFEGGGPQLELLRRLAHWMMGEPELEEESLTAEAVGQQIRIIRRSLDGDVGAVTITAPDGTESEVTLEEVSPGRYEALFAGNDMGLYRLAEGDHEIVIGLGPAAPREFEQTIASGDDLGPLLASTGGGVWNMTDGVPAIRDVRPGRPAIGRGWIGLTPRDATEARDISRVPLLPAWAVLLVVSMLIIGAWLREGRS
ncbi:hypothetical protein [Donghicola eburneus]|uniref:Putative membrane protein n=1 Tax=Donghicola eburneus TaxID=393278 RepID=A0A1M4MYB5_9RHOB|nr:hypothetical protein [Donghicola eburneus]SCM66788.1 putative membrane protein [Donghicola eburneus]SFQ60160.1 hypothetical protein SAMN05421764_10765 [Donghicola eburneus]